jgi:perosamine synthetase
MPAHPLQARALPISRPSLGEREARAAARAVLSGWVTQGPEVAAFEREFADWARSPYACAVSNCTTALHLALLVAGVEPGDEVVTVSHSFIATANAIRYCGATPVFVDIDPMTFNIDPALVEQAISPKTRAMIVVHQLGMPADLERILPIAKRHGLVVVEDAACAAGSEIYWNGRWQPIGLPHGDIACFSFHPRKVITTGDGGMITTARRDWDAQFRLWRQHGMTVPDTVRHGSPRVIVESYDRVGFNYRMTDIQAAVGREQLQQLPEIVERRRMLAARYGELLADVSDIRPPYEPPWARSNWQSYCAWLSAGVDQRSLMQAMLDEGVSTKPGVMCAHRQPAYEREPWIARPQATEESPRPLAISEAAEEHAILLPLYPALTDEDQERIVAALIQAVGAVRR